MALTMRSSGLGLSTRTASEDQFSNNVYQTIQRWKPALDRVTAG